MTRLMRAGLLALALPSLYAGLLLLSPPRATAALLALKPGPIDHPLHLVGADFDRDGYDDIAIANFQAGTVTVLMNQKNGTFAIQKGSPSSVGAATVGQPSAEPLFLATGDLDPEDVDGDRVRNDVDDCPTVYNPPNCRADDPTGEPECFVDIPCKDPSKAPLTCTTLDPVTLQCDSDGNGVGDQCQVLDAACQPIDSDGDGVPDYNAGAIDNCPLTPNPAPQLVETAAGLDGVCDTPDDNFFLYGDDNVCGGPLGDKTSRVGAACSRSADLIILNGSSGGGSVLGLVRVRVNDGTGGLLSRTTLQASIGPSQAVLADFNGDRRLDLVMTNSGTDALLYYPGADDGELGGVCSGGSNAGLSCLSNSQCSGGTCEQTKALLTSGVCLGGINPGQTCASNDNCPGGGVCRSSAALGSPSCSGGTAQGKSCTRDSDCPGGGICRSPAGPEGVAAADFNGDGRPDLAFTNRTTGTMGVLLNPGGAAFVPAPGSPFTTANQPVEVLAQAPLVCAGGGSAGAPCVKDLDCPGGGSCLPRSLDGDACADPVVLSQGPLICVGGGTPGSACATDDDCGAGGVCRASYGRIQVFTASCATGSMIPGQVIDLGAGHAPRGGVLADFDRDGNLDLAVPDFTGGQVLVFRGSGAGTFSLAVTLTGLSSPAAVAALNFDPNNGPNVDLAVLGYDNRVDLFTNTSSGSLSFALAPTSPVSPWKTVSAMAVFAADASAGLDLTLLNNSPPNLDVLSGTGITFRGLPPEPIGGAASATGMTVADLRQDSFLDVLAFDSVGGAVIPLISELTGAQTVRLPIPAGSGPVQAAIAPLTLHGGDYDQDGVPDAQDNCPTRYNPPGCPANDKAGFPQCFVDNPCKSLADQLTGCSNTNPAGQCDNDSDGVGDQCEVLDSACQNIDTDLDLVPDYDQSSTPRRIDNCPWLFNPSQTDTDADGIGDDCDGSTCNLIAQTCNAGPKLNEVCSQDVDCDAPINDAAVVDAAGGALSFLIGDASGNLRPAPGTWSAINLLANPVAAVVGRFSYNPPSYTCPIIPPIVGVLTCVSDAQPDIMVAERGGPGSGDDHLKLYFGGSVPGSFAPPPPAIPSQISLQGDPTELLIAQDQSVCPNPWLVINDTRYHFDNDGKTSVIAVLEPATKDFAIYLPSNEGPAPPPGHTARLPLESTPVDAAFVDLNQDGYMDLVSLSSGDGNPATTNLMVHIGMGNGLFFTDPSLNSTDVPDGMTLMAEGNVNLATDFTYPDLVLFDGVNQAPLIMTNVLTDRADIDRSGRVDGFDLALLARAFGSERGENFTIQPDGTILQNPDLASNPGYIPTRVVVGAGGLKDGMDLPSTSGSASGLLCDRALQPVTGLYGIPVDINLDGKVEGLDLALLASRFGRNIP